jgi:TetR/AcrR family transcriptional regulator
MGDMPVAARTRRDAERSRAALLDAAEELFADRGFDGASLAEIAAAAGLSRAAPNYFFGNKDELYVAVLERVFAAREAATEGALQPLLAWARGEGRLTLQASATEAVTGYLDFLLARPAFVRVLQQEELRGGRWLRAARRRSHAMSEVFEELRSRRRELGLGNFKVDDAVLLFVSLTFSPLAQRATFMAALGRDLDDPKTRREHTRLVVSHLLHVIQAGS